MLNQHHLNRFLFCEALATALCISAYINVLCHSNLCALRIVTSYLWHLSLAGLAAGLVKHGLPTLLRGLPAQHAAQALGVLTKGEGVGAQHVVGMVGSACFQLGN
jgi:hypothetical protein